MNEISVQEQEKIKAETNDLVTLAQGLEIKTELDNTQAATLTAQFKAEIKRRKGILAPTKAALDAQKAAYNGLVAMMIDPLDESVGIIVQKVGAFTLAENRRRAELQRIEDEKAAAAQRKEDERIAKLNAKAAEKNKPPPVIIPKMVMPARIIPKVAAPAGTTHITYYSAKVVEPGGLKALCLAVAEGREPESLVMANMPALNARARENKIDGAIVAPGVVVVATGGLQQR